MRYLFSLFFVVLLVVAAQSGGLAFADSHEMPGYDAKHLRLQMKSGGHLDVEGPLRSRGGVFLFRINGKLVSLPSDRVTNVTPIEKPVEKPAQATPVEDPAAPVPMYELRGDPADPAADPAPASESDEAAPAPQEDESRQLV